MELCFSFCPFGRVNFRWLGVRRFYMSLIYGLYREKQGHLFFSLFRYKESSKLLFCNLTPKRLYRFRLILCSTLHIYFYWSHASVMMLVRISCLLRCLVFFRASQYSLMAFSKAGIFSFVTFHPILWHGSTAVGFAL